MSTATFQGKLNDGRQVEVTIYSDDVNGLEDAILTIEGEKMVSLAWVESEDEAEESAP